MLTRLHVDNFRCLVHFNLKLDRLSLLLGDNGAGKTTVFDVIRRLRDFLGGETNVDAAFPGRDLTRWEDRNVQHFELDLQVAEDAYQYALFVEHAPQRTRRRVMHESLHMNESVLFEFTDGLVHLYYDDFTSGPEYPCDWSRSGLASLPSRPDNTKLTRFRQQVGKWVVANLSPKDMKSVSREDAGHLGPEGANFASWYRFLSQENQGNILELTQELRAVLPGFDSFSLTDAGDSTKVLRVLFRGGPRASKLTPFSFKELSDGQRQLIVLYTLLYGVKGQGHSLFLDEPENYVALREIQPWLSALQDAVGDSISQAVLISHHPEVIDYLAGSSGRWLERPDNGPTRVLDKPPAAVDGLRLSETIARGLEA